MNRVDGIIEDIRGSGAIRLAGVGTDWGLIQALVLNLGSEKHPLAKGQPVRVLFKETTLVAAGVHHNALRGRIITFAPGDALVVLHVENAQGHRLQAHLPASELPPSLSVGDEIGLFVPASAVALERL